MIASHTIKLNGKWYYAGQEIPEKPIEVPLPKEETAQAEHQYTKTEINRLSTADLQKLAVEQGLNSELSGAELKKLLIAKLGL